MVMKKTVYWPLDNTITLQVLSHHHHSDMDTLISHLVIIQQKHSAPYMFTIHSGPPSSPLSPWSTSTSPMHLTRQFGFNSSQDCQSIQTSYQGRFQAWTKVHINSANGTTFGFTNSLQASLLTPTMTLDIQSNKSDNSQPYWHCFPYQQWLKKCILTIFATFFSNYICIYVGHHRLTYAAILSGIWLSGVFLYPIYVLHCTKVHDFYFLSMYDDPFLI